MGKTLEMKSVQFPLVIPTSEGIKIKRQIPISLTVGMEKRIKFSNQEEGEKTVAEYISYTLSYNIIKEERKQTLKKENLENWKKAKRKEEEFLEVIRQF